MALIYVTGPTGSGKSTICEELRNLNYEVYDTDKGGIRYWIDSTTGEPIKTFKKNELLDKKWLNEHQLGLPKSWLEKLGTKDKTIFICGTSPIDHSDTNIYDKIIVLTIDQETLTKRINSRTNNLYGKDPKQLNNAIKWRQATIDRYKKAGAYEIDGTLPIKTIVNKILTLVS